MVVVQKANTNYATYSPDVLGCVATGKTVEASLKNMQEALEMHLEYLAEFGEKLPVPRDSDHYIQDSEPIAELNDLITYLRVPTPQLQGV